MKSTTGKVRDEDIAKRAGSVARPWGPQPGRARILAILLGALFLTAGLLGACIPDLQNPPRLSATPAGLTGQASDLDEPLRLPAPTSTGTPLTQESSETERDLHTTLTLWVNTTSPQYESTLRRMIDDFSAGSDVHVELVTIAPDLLPDLVRTAAVSTSFDLPDMVVLPLEYASGWATDGILDADAAHDIVQDLDAATFNQEALELVTVDEKVSAIPSDGWQQLLLYRSDWFREAGVQAPTSYERMLTAAEVISDRANLIYGFNMPTESSLRATTRAFEHLAIANGCQLVDEKGELTILDPQCRDSLAFYRFLCNTYCPPGVQTEVSTLNAYLEGRSAMIMTNPGVLPALAGLDERYPPQCAECEQPEYLVQNTGIVTNIVGRSDLASSQNLGEIAYLGITRNADRQASEAFARFWFNEGYLQWLAVEPERKVPMRLGTPDEPTRFRDAWFDLAVADDGRTISDIFGREVALSLATDVVNSDRWGYKQGEGPLITAIFEELTISTLLQELLSGYYNSERAAIEGYERLVDLIPDYQYYVDPEPEE